MVLDAENRLPWDGAVPLPEVPTFPPDAITKEVAAMVEATYGHHPGRVTPEDLPASAADAERAWRGPSRRPCRGLVRTRTR